MVRCGKYRDYPLILILLKSKVIAFKNSFLYGSTSKKRIRRIGLIFSFLLPIFLIKSYSDLVKSWSLDTVWMFGDTKFLLLFVLLFLGGLSLSLHFYFLSSDLDWLRAKPLSSLSILLIKLVEVAIANSLLYIYVGLPFLIALLPVAVNPLGFFLYIVLSSIAFLILTSSLAGLLSCGIVALFAAKRSQRFTSTVFGLVMIGVWLSLHLGQSGHESGLINQETVARAAQWAQSQSLSWLPSHWLITGNISWLRGNYGTSLLYAFFLMLLAGIFVILLNRVLVYAWRRPRFDGQFAPVKRSKLIQRSVWLAQWTKEILAFKRDSRMTLQIVLLTVMTAVLPFMVSEYDSYKSLMTAFILIIMSNMMAASFAAMMLPYERQSFWILKSAPLSIRRILFAKQSIAALYAWMIVSILSVWLVFEQRLSGPIYEWWILFAFSHLGAATLGLLSGAWFGDIRWENPNRMLTPGGMLVVMISNALFSLGIIGCWISRTWLNSGFLIPLMLWATSTIWFGTRLSSARLQRQEWLM
jgi:ABC-2 type transport system permease protein